jgi:NADH:ubiquinone oxidoreductase subunit 3 (subunit A)
MNPHPYAFLAVFVAVAIAFPVGLLMVARLWFRFFQPAKPSEVKNAVYECGVAPTGDSWIQFKAHYYLYAILFLIFDVEVLFLLPFAVAFSGLSKGALIAMALFILLLAEGLVWAWHRGHLEWK